MSITRSASGRDRTWDDNWDKWDGSDNGWIEVGQGSDDSQGFAGIERAPGLVHQLLNAFAQGLLVNDPAISGPPVDTHQLPNPPDQGPVNDPALLAVDAHHLLNSFFVDGGDPAVSGPPVDAHQLPNPLDQGPVNDPALLAVDAHHLLNSFFLDGGDPAVSGPPVDAHQLPNPLDQGPVNDPALLAVDAHHLLNSFFLDGGDPAVSGPPVDAH